MYDYNNKYKTSNKEGYGGRHSIFEIMSLPSNEGRYKADNIHEVIIDNDRFTNYSAFKFGWEKSYVKSPSRSTGGSIGDLNSMPTFVTPRLVIDFSLMSIDDYRLIARKSLEKNEFIVTCYDPIYNRSTTNKMYFATSDLAKLKTISRVRFNADDWEDYIDLVGVEDYTVELIGTNNDLDTVDVIYYLNAPTGATGGSAYQSYAESGLRVGDYIILGNAAQDIVNETFNGAYEFVVWNLSPDPDSDDKGNYNNGEEIRVPKDGLVLYAKWKSTSQHTLTYNYGIADPAINEETYEYVRSKTVTKGVAIGTLPTFNTPKAVYNGREYDAYENGAWYKLPIKASNSAPVTSSTQYWSDRDSAIYLLFDAIKYNLILYADDKEYSSTQVPYNSSIILPMLVQSGKQFDGWYTSDEKKWSQTVMPPYDLTLYARWKSI